MAKKSTEAYAPVVVTNLEEARAALEEMEAIQAEIEPKMARQVELKKAATAYAVKKKVAAIQLDDHYYRQITRSSTEWDEDKLKEITEDVKIKGKSLWLKITRRRLDNTLLDRAVARGWISEKKVAQAFTSSQGNPFLQKFTGEAADGQ